MKSLFLIALTVAAVTAENTFCTPGSTFTKNCNICTCSEDGKTAACTDMVCPEEQIANFNDLNTSENESKKVCTPFSQFKDYCNICACADDGLSFSCTRMMCDKDLWNKDGSLKIVLKSHRKPRSASEQVCTPKTKFMDYCNICACADDGLSFTCTRRMCDKDIWNKDGSLKITPKSHRMERSAPKRVCTPRTQFMDYCNTCACADDGLSFACTRRMCDKEIWNKDGTLKNIPDVHQSKRSGKVCEPGSVYSPDDCNTCVCDESGTHSACTLKLCLPTLKEAFSVEETKKWGPLYNQGDKCTPGKVFYSECNQCVCMNSGNSAFCTLMTCHKKA